MSVTGTNEEPVVFGGRYQRFPDSLSIATVIKSDSGAYRCNATNIKGTQSAQAYLLVISECCKIIKILIFKVF